MANLFKTIRSWSRYGYEYAEFKRRSRQLGERFPMLWRDRYPCLRDRTKTTDFDRHYIYHTAWAARILAASRPAMHIDISSSLYFSAIVSAFVPVRFYDYRPAQILLDNLTPGAADICALPFTDGSVASLSCMHVVEHVGLGRYGDPLDPDGDRKAAAELMRVLAPGGSLLFVVPVGRPRIMFNAHRIYSSGQVLDLFAGLTLEEFALIPDDPAQGGLIRNAPPALTNEQRYGCGCFLFRRAL